MFLRAQCFTNILEIPKVFYCWGRRKHPASILWLTRDGMRINKFLLSRLSPFKVQPRRTIPDQLWQSSRGHLPYYPWFNLTTLWSTLSCCPWLRIYINILWRHQADQHGRAMMECIDLLWSTAFSPDIPLLWFVLIPAVYYILPLKTLEQQICNGLSSLLDGEKCLPTSVELIMDRSLSSNFCRCCLERLWIIQPKYWRRFILISSVWSR